MKNIGLFVPLSTCIDDLTKLGLSLGGQPIDKATLRFGEIPEEAYLDLSTDLSNGCFDDDEFKTLEFQQLRAPFKHGGVGRLITLAHSNIDKPFLPPE